MNSTALDAFPSLGIQIHIPILTAMIVAAVVIGLGLVIGLRDNGDYGMIHGGAFIGWILTIIGGISAIIFALSLIPYQASYWQMYEVRGTVEHVTNTLTDGSGELATAPVAQIAGLDRSVRIDDPRILLLEGQDVGLNCTKTWHYRAADTYSCRILDFPEVTR